MKKILLLVLILYTLLNYAQSGQVGINTRNPDPTAVLEIFSNDKGVLIPRLTEKQIKGIQSPATGLMIFNTTKNCIVMRENKGWSDCPGRDVSRKSSFRFAIAISESSPECHDIIDKASAILHSPGWAKITLKPNDNIAITSIKTELYTSNDPNADEGNNLFINSRGGALIMPNGSEKKYLHYKGTMKINKHNEKSTGIITCRSNLGVISPLPQTIAYGKDGTTLLTKTKEKITRNEYRNDNNKNCKNLPLHSLKILGVLPESARWSEATTNDINDNTLDRNDEESYWIENPDESAIWTYLPSRKKFKYFGNEKKEEKYYGLCTLRITEIR